MKHLLLATLLLPLFVMTNAYASKVGDTHDIAQWEKSARPLWDKLEASRKGLTASAIGLPITQMERIEKLSDTTFDPMMSQLELDKLYRLMSRMRDPHDVETLKSEFNHETEGVISDIDAAMSQIQLLVPLIENQDSIEQVTEMQGELSKMKDAMVSYRSSVGLK